MAYLSGDLILDDHYNGFASDTNDVLGTGSGASGYGQANTVSSVAAGTIISATQWATLLSKISLCANHQGSSLTSITNPSAGDTISAYTALTGNIITINNSKSNAVANGADITRTDNYTSIWYTSVTATHTITFGSADELRYFLNAGGMIRVSSSRSGGTSNNKNTEWTDLVGSAKMGTIAFTGEAGSKTIAGTSYTGTTKVGGGGTTNILTTGTGVNGWGTGYTNYFRQYADTSPYTSNYVTIACKDNGSNILYVQTTYTDAAGDTTSDYYGAQTHDRVDGTLATTVTVRQPSTTYISSTWGTPTITSTSSGS
jgi:hypothetical protein